jgi:hypothetical protein
MDTIPDFEDMLDLLERFEVRYLVIGGMAFIYHAKPRYTKDMDLWIDPDPENVERANRALAEFGSPYLLDPGADDQILQLGVAPSRIDLLRDTGSDFAYAWARRVRGRYGRAEVSWIDLDSLIGIKSQIDDPRHQDDARILRMVREGRSERE